MGLYRLLASVTLHNRLLGIIPHPRGADHDQVVVVPYPLILTEP
jgi:hypothetical protein